MNNLEVLHRRPVSLVLEDEGEKILAATFDGEHDRAFFISDSSRLYWLQNQDQNYVSLAETMEPDTVVAGMEYMLELEAVVIGTRSGELLLVQPSSGDVLVVGTLQGGISSMASSPDGELLAVVTGLGQVLLMTPDWDILFEFAISQSQHEDNVHEASKSVRLSWRPDAKFFTTIEYSPHKEQGIVKIWERDAGKLHSSADAVATIEPATTWCPGGARIAVGTSKIGASPSVIIIERNGLKKDSFQLTAPAGAKVESLQWDSKGDVLCALIRCDGWDSIQLWHCSNYRWYLKQEWRHLPVQGINMIWHPEKPLVAMTWTTSGIVDTLALGWKSAVSDTSVALVIDGPTVLVTPLARSIIPPPLHLFRVTFTAPVNAVTMTKDYSTLAASLTNGELGLATLPNEADWSDLDDRQILGSALQNFAGAFRNLIAVNATYLCGIVQSSEPEKLVKLRVENVGGEWTARSVMQVPLNQPVAAIARGPSSSDIYMQLQDGSILSHSVDTVPGSTAVVGRFPTSCPWMAAFEDKEGTCFVGLDESGKLYLGDITISEECTSFSLHASTAKAAANIVHVIYTSRQDLLHIVNLDNSIVSPANEVVNITPNRKGHPVEKNFNVQRVWERGARIVAALGGGDVAVILQTGRGNLETIYPRGLILQTVAASLAEHRFREAIMCARRHRIDLNVIVDFIGASEFAASASEFVKQVGKLNLVTELVSCLRKENVLEATYKKTLSLLKLTQGTSSNPADKMQIVLEALRSAIEKDVSDSSSRELCLLTIFAKNDPPLLEEALIRIKRLRETEIGRDRLDELGQSGRNLSAEGALKHLIWLADENAVFNAALGLYDLHLAAMVGSSSQRDPKEFLPYLYELEKMPPHVMRYKIDNQLHRYESALRNLCSAGSSHFEEAMELLRQHPELFAVALAIFTDKNQLSRIREAWGDYFLGQEKFEDAAMAYSSCHQLNKALGAYRAGGIWQGVLMVAGQLRMAGSDVVNLANDLREELQAMGRPREAARVALDYCKDVEGGVSLLMDARDWMEVLRVCYLHAKEDVIEKTVVPTALECASTLVAQFEEGIEKVRKYAARLGAVRQRRLLLEAKVKADGEDEREEDMLSEASSNLSGMSVYTHGTAKTTATGRSRARRQGRIRAGSPGEEMALVEHLKSMAISPHVKEELRSLLQVLVCVGKEDMSCKLQQAAVKLEGAQAEAMQSVTSSNWGYEVLERGLGGR